MEEAPQSIKENSDPCGPKLRGQSVQQPPGPAELDEGKKSNQEGKVLLFLESRQELVEKKSRDNDHDEIISYKPPAIIELTGYDEGKVHPCILIIEGIEERRRYDQQDGREEELHQYLL